MVRKAQSSVAVALSSALPPVVKTPDGIHNRQRFASLRERFTASAPALGPRGRLTRGVCVCVCVWEKTGLELITARRAFNRTALPAAPLARG